VQSWQAAEEGVRLLRSGIDGRATFLVHPDASAVPATMEPQEIAAEGLIPLHSTIRVLNGFRGHLEAMLPKLLHGYLAPDAATARELSVRHPHAWFLTPSGECFHSATVSGGKQAAEGPLAVKRELRDAERKLATISADLEKVEADAVAAARSIEELTGRLEHATEMRRQSERDAANQGAALRQMEQEVERIARRLQEWTTQAARNLEARNQKQALITQKLEESARLEAEHRAAEVALEEQQQQLAELRHER
jgi:chromosome segregation protein